jgi:endogenous inhibitor of DNA gyrase (YacG/DUF329 family)
MTSYGSKTVKCSVCGQDSEQGIIMSTNSFGSMDLDMRPPEMERSSMDLWLQECPHCGYVANSLETPIGFALGREYLSTSDYNN